MVTPSEAHRLIGECTPLLPAEEVLLRSLQGRVLAAAVAAPFSLPRFTNAAMDGFALRGAEIAEAGRETPVVLKVSARVAAGADPAGPLEPGTAVEIMTGAPMVEGADTVVPFEMTSGFGGSEVAVQKPVAVGANVRHQGEEVREGEPLLAAGTRLDASAIAVLASFGIDRVAVRRQPRLSIVTVGDELNEPGVPLSGSGIYDANSFMLQAACRSLGIEPTAVRRGVDDREEVRRLLRESLAESDLLITAGGISTGEYDFVQSELMALGVEKRFWSVAQKPGKPLYFGTAPGGKLVFSLPGNPVSALVCFVEYCSPVIAAMQGLEAAGKVTAVLESTFPTDRKRHRFLLGRLRNEAGRLLCTVSGKVESHMITAAAGANCIIEAPSSEEPLPKGTGVVCTLLPWATPPC